MRTVNRRSGIGRLGMIITVLTFLIVITGGVPPVQAGPTIAVMVEHFNVGAIGSTYPSGIAYCPATGNFAITDSTEHKVYIVDSHGVSKGKFDTTAFDCSVPNGITYIDSGDFAGNLAVVDNRRDEVFIVNKSGILQHSFDTGAFGANSPMGIAYISSGSFEGNFAIVDDAIDDEVYIVDSDGAVQAQFDTTAFGSSSPMGISFMASTENFAIVDNYADEVFITNTAGSLQNQFDVGFVSSNSCGIVFNPDTGEFITIDNSAKEAFVLNTEGEFFASFSTALFGSTSPMGITAISSTGDFAIVDDVGDEVFFVTSDGILQDSCDISSFSDRARGISSIASTGKFAIADYNAKKIFVIDGNCNLQDQFDLGTFGLNISQAQGISFLPDVIDKFAVVDSAYSGKVVTVDITRPDKMIGQFSTSAVRSTAPTGICLIPSSNHFAITDSNADGAFVVDTKGRMRARFSTALFSTTPQGIAFNPDTEVFAIVDNDNDAVYLLKLPSIVAPPNPPFCEGDFDQDGDVDGNDLAVFEADFGRTDCPF